MLALIGKYLFSKYLLGGLAGYGLKAFFAREEAKLSAELKKVRAALGIKRALFEHEIAKLADFFKKL